MEKDSTRRQIFLTCVDGYGTNLREDGFMIEKHEITLSSVSPSHESVNFDKLKEALKTANITGRFFDKSSLSKFSLRKDKTVPVVSVHIDTTLHDRKRVLIEDGLIENMFTFEQATYLIRNEYANQRNKLILTEALYFAEKIRPFQSLKRGATEADMIVSSFTSIFNKSCSEFLCDRDIPLLYVKRSGGIGVDYHFGFFSHPLRDATSLINNMQLSFYLEHGEVLFSEKFLKRLI